MAPAGPGPEAPQLLPLRCLFPTRLLQEAFIALSASLEALGWSFTRPLLPPGMVTTLPMAPTGP